MNTYIALTHPPEGGSSWGITFPDVPGCVSAGDSFEEVLTGGREALSSHLALSAAEGDPVPPARSFETLRADPDLAEDFRGAIVAAVEPREVAAPRVRVNVTIDPALLRQADEFAEANGLTRSGLIEDALGARLREFLPGPASLPMDGIVAARRSATGAAADTRQTRLQEDVQGSEEHSVARAGRLREEVLVRPPSRILRKAGKRQKQGT